MLSLGYFTWFFKCWYIHFTVGSHFAFYGLRFELTILQQLWYNHSTVKKMFFGQTITILQAFPILQCKMVVPSTPCLFQRGFIFYRQRPVSRQGRKKTFQAPKGFIFYRQRPVSRQGRKKHFSGPKKFYFLSPEAGQQARKEKNIFRPQKVLFSIARGRSAGKEGKKNLPQKVLFSIARGRSAGKEGKKTFQAPKSFIFYRQRPVGRQGRKKKF